VGKYENHRWMVVRATALSTHTHKGVRQAVGGEISHS
jgi:hypothetical protein